MLKRNVVQFPRLLSVGNVSNGFVAWLFGSAGPLLIVLQAATKGHLSDSTTSSWIFAIYGIGGLLTLLMSLYYGQPIGYAFSIPGAILVGSALTHYALNLVVGAYIITGIIIFLLGISGLVTKLMKVLPMPVMMGMVSGVLLPFGTDMVHSVMKNPLLNGIPLLVFLALSFFLRFSKKFPPILGAIIAAILCIKFLPGVTVQPIHVSIGIPQFITPSFSFSVIGELVIPLILTVIAIQNAQGIAMLESSGYRPPINSMTNWSGIGSIVNAFFGGHPACIAGPMTALLANKDSGKHEHRYVAAIVLGILSCLLALFSPMASEIPHVIPASLIQLLGGVAMISVLVDSLKMSFSGPFKSGALFSFLITISGISIFHIGAPFWGLIGGTLATLFLDKQDLKKPVAPSQPIQETAAAIELK
ncbi:benzoate/H(+) symporter BenE family transporter [Pullulanibacillus sp. KACC 23026]|uniref:benzoate/H(+) symporter BenE family transporter n=1 Tax=Pullulanibacillus sp. KACC 23026 TaxID=3028315 RepID=UPI0023B1A142|nr:benzoate/H(+) symporter BenE family transporter [Pullulanibacillus sp. KACC 23026]WEG10976.1 benzoate/H(+) symporter BenE family transporter [Pullulanibacillus sp. KACC 23026]